MNLVQSIGAKKLAIFAGIFAIVAYITLNFAFQAGPAVSFEAENANYPNKKTDSQASNNSYIEFVTVDDSAPWADALALAIARAGGATVGVNLPQNGVGPRVSSFRPISSEDGSLVNGRWRLSRDVSGVDFGAADVDLNGHTATDFIIEVKPRGDVDRRDTIVGSGEIGWFKVSNPNNIARHIVNADGSTVYVHNFYLDNIGGDGLKAGQNGRIRAHDGFIKASNQITSGIHFDGIQVHSGFPAGTGGWVDQAERIVVDLNEVGVVTGCTSAILSQANASIRNIGDFLVLNPGGCFYPIRFGGGGAHTVSGPLQVIGRQGVVSTGGGSGPKALIRLTTSSISPSEIELINNVPNARDYEFN